jgi:hypothetical protein
MSPSGSDICKQNHGPTIGFADSNLNATLNLQPFFLLDILKIRVFTLIYERLIITLQV